MLGFLITFLELILIYVPFAKLSITRHNFVLIKTLDNYVNIIEEEEPYMHIGTNQPMTRIIYQFTHISIENGGLATPPWISPWLRHLSELKNGTIVYYIDKTIIYEM